MKPLTNYVLIAPVLQAVTKSGIILDSVIDPYSGEAGYFSASVAKVVAICDKLYYNREASLRGDPASMGWKTEIEVEIGDEVFFNYLSGISAQKGESKTCHKFGDYYLIPYSELIAKRNSKGVIGLNGRILLLPLYESPTSTISLGVAQCTKRAKVFATSKPLANYAFLGKNEGNCGEYDEIDVGDEVVVSTKIKDNEWTLPKIEMAETFATLPYPCIYTQRFNILSKILE